MATGWTAHYLDGRTAGRRRVHVTVTATALRFSLPDHTEKQWPYEHLRQTQGAYRGEPVRLEYGPEPAEALVISTPTLLTAIHDAAPTLAQHFHNPAQRAQRARWTIVAAVAVVLLLGGLYRWGIPGVAAAATPLVPVTWEETLGEQVVERLAPEGRQCRDPERLRKLDQIAQTLAATRPTTPYRIRLTVVDAPAVNAFAAPGGRIVILRGLLEKTTGPEQLAGVLAHELQHVYQRHTTRAILEQTATTFLLAAISGDLSGGLAWGLQGAQAMGSLHYSRTHETEADLEGLRMLQAAHLDPTAMITFFGLMQQSESSEADAADALDFLSTHPNMIERTDALAALAGPPAGDVRPLLPGDDWTDIRTLCRLQHPPHPTPLESNRPSPPAIPSLIAGAALL